MKCQHCKKKIQVKDKKYLPFCSSRCKSLDLSNWLSEVNKIPSSGITEQDKF